MLAKALKVRIHFINRYYRPDHSATAQILTGVAESLASRGHEVRVVTSRQYIDEPRAGLPIAETLDGVQIRRMRTPHFGRGWILGRLLDYLGFYIGAAWRILVDARKGDVVVAKTDPPLLGVVLGPLATLRGALTVNWLQDVYPEVARRLGVLPMTRPIWGLLKHLRNRSLRHAAANVVIGRSMRALLTRRGIPTSKLTHIPNFSADMVHHVMPDPENPLRRQLGVAPEDFVVAYSGNLGRAHPLESWLQAAKALRDHPRIHHLCIGGGAGRPALEQAVAEAELPRWHFLNYQPRERLSESLGAANMHLVMLNPLLEGLILPSKIYGVLACGRPCLYIGSEHSEIAALLCESACGETAAPADAAATAATIRAWADNRAHCEQMGLRGRRAFDRAYTRERVAKRWDDFLRALS